MDFVKKISRYLKGRPRLVLRYRWQKSQDISVYSDSDYAGCRKTRKSTSGGVILRGAHPIKSWSKQQKVIALSSAEAETYGMVTASCEALGLIACAKDFWGNARRRRAPSARAFGARARARAFGARIYIYTGW